MKHNPADIEIGHQKLKMAFTEINKWEYDKILQEIKDIRIDTNKEFFEKTLQDCFDAMERNKKKSWPYCQNTPACSYDRRLKGETNANSN